MTMWLIGLALAQDGGKKFEGELRTLELDEPGGAGGAPLGMAFIVPPGTTVDTFSGPLSGDNKGLRLGVRQAGDALACTSSIAASGSLYVKARVKIPEIVPGPAAWHGLNMEVRARSLAGALVSPPGSPYVLLANLREPTDWTTVESKVTLPAGTASAEVCLRFVHSTGVLELDRLQIVAPKGDLPGLAATPTLPAATPLPPATPVVAPTPPPMALPPAQVVTPTAVTPPPAPVATPEPEPTRSSRKSKGAVASTSSEGGVALRLDQPGSALACGPWMAGGAFKVEGTLDVSAQGMTPPDWSGVLVEGVAQDSAGRPVSTSAGPSTPLFSLYEPARDRTFDATFSPPSGTARARVCVRFNAASGNAEISARPK